MLKHEQKPDFCPEQIVESIHGLILIDKPNPVDTVKTFSVKSKQPDLIVKNTSPSASQKISEDVTWHIW